MIESRHWRVDDKQDVRGIVDPDAHLIVVDPGSKGMVVFYRPMRGDWQDAVPSPWGLAVLHGVDARGVHTKASRFDAQISEGRYVIVAEENYGGGRMNIQSDLQLSRSAGAAVGAILSALTHDVSIIWVASGPWQADVLGCTQKHKRKERKAMAQAFAKPVFDGVAGILLTKDHVEAFFDCTGMAAWYRKQCKRKDISLWTEEDRHGR